MAKDYKAENKLLKAHIEGIRKRWDALLSCVGCSDYRGIFHYYQMPDDAREAFEAMDEAVRGE